MLIPLVAVLGAFVPTVFYVSFVWWLDRYEKEPLRLLILAFVWGAIPAAIVSVLLELLFDIPIYTIGGTGLIADLASASISAPLVEESAKGIALIVLVLIFSREFDDILDGIVYGAMIGFGFALSENVGAYFLPILKTEGLGAGLINILMRTVIFGFNHALWTGITGAAVGYARLSQGWGQRIVVPIAGWSLAVLLHSIHNAGATLVEQTLCLSLGVSLVVDWGGVVLLLAVATLALRKERRWIQRGLAEEVRRGELSPEEFEILTSASKRLFRRWQALGQGGRAAYRSLGRYYQCATELAFKKQQLCSVGDEGGNSLEIQRLRQQLAASRTLAWPWLRPGDS